MIELPTTPIVSIRKNPKTLVLYGPPKGGKTTILSHLDGCLIIDLEDGSDYVNALKLKVKTQKEFSELLDQLSASCPYKYVAIDTIDVVEQWCEVEATRLYKQSPQGANFTGKSVLTLPMGAGYLWLRTAFHQAIDKIKKACPQVILIGHLRDKMIEGKDKDGVATKDLDLTGKIRSIVCAYADAIGYVSRNKAGELSINFKTTEEVTCGARPEHLRGQLVTFTNPPLDWKKIYVD